MFGCQLQSPLQVVANWQEAVGASGATSIGLTQSQAIENLVANGYVKTMSKDGTLTIMNSGDKAYRFYPQSTGGGIAGAPNGVPSASASFLDAIIAKLRFVGE